MLPTKSSQGEAAIMPVLCRGRAIGEACVFGNDPGARAPVTAETPVCALCSSDVLTEYMDAPKIYAVIKHVKALDPERQGAALALMGEEHRARFEEAMQESFRCVGRPGKMCVYGKHGQKYSVHMRGQRCMFCEEGCLVYMCTNAARKRRVASRMVGQSAVAPRNFKELLPVDSVADVKEALNKAEDQTKKAMRGRPVLDIPAKVVARQSNVGGKRFCASAGTCPPRRATNSRKGTASR